MASHRRKPSFVFLIRGISQMMEQNKVSICVPRPAAAAAASNTSPQQARCIHRTPSRRPAEKGEDEMSLRNKFLTPIAEHISQNVLPTSVSRTYWMYAATGHMYKHCAEQAAYHIADQDRREGKVKLADDGEEVGTSSGSGHGRAWHEEFGLVPTFSTWAHVTMLHMYLIVVRLRCLDRDTHQLCQTQLVDHYFYDAETKMEALHAITSSSTRQRYLKDLIVQWRGVIVAYDEGLVKGDAVLAEALWRNLFKAREDVDVRHLAAIVGWVRMCLSALDELSDDTVTGHAQMAFKTSPASMINLVDKYAEEMKD